jgi:phage terminase large subunit GpA-like protein
MSGTQVAKTTTLENMQGYIIDQDPGPTLVVVPTEDDIGFVGEKKIKPMIYDSMQLTKHTTGSPRDLQGSFYNLDRMTIYFASAGSIAALAQKSIRYLFFDEPDKYPPFSGREANPIDLGEKRTTTWWDRKIVMACTPTTRNGYIYQAYDDSNMQRYYIPCPHCGEYRVWKCSQIRVPKTLREPDEIIAKNDVWYECEVCGKKIEEIEKPKLVAAGIWLPEGLFLDANGKTKGEPKRTKRKSGFAISSVVSPFELVRWCRIMAAWFEANTEEGIARGKRMDFSNAYDGEPYEPQGKQLRASDVRKLEGFFSAHTVPADCVMLTVGADYHKSEVKGIIRIDFEVRGFALDKYVTDEKGEKKKIAGKNYVIDSGWASNFDEFDERIFGTPFPWSDGTAADQKSPLGPCCAFIDSGFEPDDVYNYCRRRPGITIPIKGEEGPLMKPLRMSDLEVATERRIRSRHSRMWYKGMQLIIIDTYYFKNQVTSWAEPTYEEDAAGGKPKLVRPPMTQFYAEIPSYYATEFTNEKLVPITDRKTGLKKYVWQPASRGAATHFFDTAVYATAAAFYKGIQNMRAKAEPAPPIIKLEDREDRKGFLSDLPQLT